MWINREYQAVIETAARTRPALLLTGARQTGKTSLFTRMFPDHSFVSLDLPSLAEMAENDPVTFLATYPPPLIIDEAQYAPALFRHLKTHIDKNRSKVGQFLLTGSQKFQLMKSVGDSLAGRIEVLELETLSASELWQLDSDSSLATLMFQGGYPELHANSELQPQRFFNSYVASYLERDLKGILNVQNLRDFERFLRALALRSGQLLNKAELAKDIGISPTTANSWISVLETSGQIALLEPWFSNKTKELTKTPKVYIRDVGLLNFLLGIYSEAEMLRSPSVGAIFETFVYAELRKIRQSQHGFARFNYYRDQKREIDFLEDRGQILSILECKWTELPEKRSAKNLQFLIEVLGRERIGLAGVVCRASNSFPLSENIQVIPLRDLRQSLA